MTQQLALATEKVERWTAKQAHATAMLRKWQTRLSALEPAAKPQPPVALVTPAATAQVLPLKAPKGKKPPKK